MNGEPEELRRHIGLGSATALVISTTVGVGIFTSTGFQAEALPHPGLILLLWALGGVLAFVGALAYAELGAAIPAAGGDYVFLRITYGGAFGFANAVLSLVAGFSAPVASMTEGFVHYLANFIPWLATEPRLLGPITANDLIAVALAWGLIGIHLSAVRIGMRFNDSIAAINLGAILLVILAAATAGSGDWHHFSAVPARYAELGAGQRLNAFATSLVFVMYTYSGWNAAAYVAGEMKNPARDLPLALLFGTMTVTALYLALNVAYLYGAGVDELAGKTEVGLVASRHLFGDRGASFVTAIICLAILGSASANTISGPRIYYAFGRDYPLFRFIGRANPRTGAPARALILQGIVTTAFILFANVDQIMQYAGFLLSLLAALAVSCVIVLRIRRPEMPRPFRCWGYPVTPLLYLIATGWMMIFNFKLRPVESSLALLSVAAAAAFFYFTQNRRFAGSSV